jgi:beta-1,4-mannosyl-glycoprotein beta-1,4-N-acetylglucosaminyltransferase
MMKNSTVRVFDCFTFFNECELLEIRLRYLWDVVDFFVLVEADRTHSGKLKKLFYQEKKDYFSWACDKLVHITSSLDPLKPDCSASHDNNPDHDAWLLENAQRNTITQGIKQAHDDDLILISDADEIPSHEAIRHSLELPLSIPVAYSQLNHYYYLNCRDVGINRIWKGTVAVRKKYIITPQNIRDCRNSILSIKNGGWHFSFLGGQESIRTKLESFAHTEYDREEIKNVQHIMQTLEENRDIFNRPGFEYVIVPFDESYPAYLRENIDRYKHLCKL